MGACSAAHRYVALKTRVNALMAPRRARDGSSAGGRSAAVSKPVAKPNCEIFHSTIRAPEKRPIDRKFVAEISAATGSMMVTNDQFPIRTLRQGKCKFRGKIVHDARALTVRGFAYFIRRHPRSVADASRECEGRDQVVIPRKISPARVDCAPDLAFVQRTKPLARAAFDFQSGKAAELQESTRKRAADKIAFAVFVLPRRHEAP